MTSKDLSPGDWISVDWIPYKLYVVENNETTLKVKSPAWSNGDYMIFQHWRFNYRNGKCWSLLGKSKENPFYNNITKLTGFVHPVVMIKH